MYVERLQVESEGFLAWILRETRCDTGLEWRKCLSCKE
jgi:hypothetical protein